VFNIFKKNNGNPPDQSKGSGLSDIADLLSFIVKRLVDHPDEVQIRETQGERTTVLEIKVNDADMGKVIGKQGRIIKSLRIVVRAAALHEGQSVSIELVDGEKRINVQD
jgi:predicted RNA-binding protein YlqC (UPF0109 family)